jgi:cobalt-zinc-cadmium efflux system outer membrane protein
LSSLSVVSAAPAESQPPEPSIGLTEALSRTIAANPDLIAYGYQIQAAEGRLQQAGLAPNPELGVAVHDVLGTDAFRGADSAETTVTLGWVLERGVREHIVEAAHAGVALRTLDAEILRLDVAAETAERFVVCLAYQERLDNARQTVALAAEAAELVAERVAAGRSLEAELARAEAILARTELVQEDYEHELVSAYHRLSAQWGETEPDFASVRGDLETLPVLEPFEALRARVDENPELMRFMSQQRLDEAEIRLAEARARPNWQVSAGVRHFAGTDDFAAVGGLTVPLRTRNRNEGRIAETRADAARTRSETAAGRVRIETALFVLHQELNHHLQVAARLSADVIPRLERALEDTRRAYELGRYAYSEWRIVQGEVFVANNELLEASVEAHRLVIEIERLTGVRAALPPAAQ